MNTRSKMNSNKLFKPKMLELMPQLDNLHFFNELDIFPNEILEAKQQQLQEKIKDATQYELFLEQKGRRPVYDVYACFQPFNEATKALYPFLKTLQQQVQPGDTILNLWDRTGWFTNLLSGLFPEQTILTIWEGNKDVLGYKGFHFWLKECENVRILFCDLNAPLPLNDNSIAFSVGLDTFHRFNQHLLLNELTRIVRKDGAILFPHVHLTNSEPEPYFDRGCKQIHGTDYAAAFQYLFKDTNWKGYVFSEPALFMANDMPAKDPIPIVSAPDNKDYNALIAILSKPWEQAALSPFSYKDISDIGNARILINSLLNINLHQQIVQIDYAYLDGSVGYLFERHPIYMERIKGLDQFTLSDLATKIIYLAKLGMTIAEIEAQINIQQTKIIKELEKLETLGLLQVVPIQEDALRLQSYLMTQQYLIPKQAQHLQALWKKAVKFFPDNNALIALEDESELTYEECDEIVYAIMQALQQEGLKQGDKIIICSKIHSEAILLFWACMQLGIVVIPLASHLSEATLTFILTKVKAKYNFLSASIYTEKKAVFKDAPSILFDEEEEHIEGQGFADWLSDIEEDKAMEKALVKHSDEAVILFTSGSTGQPKGVQLSHGNLFRSGRLIPETFHWKEDSRFFAIGGLEQMSGLRNAAIAPLHVGASVVVPRENALNNLFGIAEAIAASRATILGGNPALCRQLVKYKSELRGQIDSIKTVICTGNKLTKELRADFKKAYDLPIYNYYGLTETTGICTAQAPNDPSLDSDTIGKPIACIAQIVDANGKLVAAGKEGELRIFSENIMQAYFEAPRLSAAVIKDGWFYTQDIARFTKDGNIELLGRKRAIIKTTTEEVVYLDEIQSFIQKQPYVEDVAVCSYREEDVEKIAAFIHLKKEKFLSPIILKPQLRELLLEQLGEKKVPNQIRFLAALPYTDNGKLLKNQLINEL